MVRSAPVPRAVLLMKGDMRAIQVVEGIAMRFSIPIAAAFAAAALLMPETMMLLFTDDAELISIGASYLRCMSVAYLCWGVVEVYLAVLRSINRVVISTVMNVLEELAATASVPRWPMITEYMEKATLQLMSFPSAGRDRRTKSENSSLLRAKRPGRVPKS